MSAHASGPWTSHVDGHGGICIEDSEGRQVGFVSSRPEQQSNADLIATAPELLEALEDALRLIEHLGGNAKRQRRAIDKATGGAS